MKPALEGILYLVGDEGITIDELKQIFNTSDLEIQSVIDELIEDYNSNKHGLEIKKYGNIYKIVTKNEYKEYYKKLADVSSIRNLSQSALETLAIIAYNCPITRSKIDEMRGVSSVQMVRNLIAKDFIKEVGRSESIGKPILYGITDAFLDYFGISSLEELPKPTVNDEKENDNVDLYESKYTETVEEL